MRYGILIKQNLRCWHISILSRVRDKPEYFGDGWYKVMLEMHAGRDATRGNVRSKRQITRPRFTEQKFRQRILHASDGTYIEHVENYGEISNGQGRWRRIAFIAIDLVPLASLHFCCTLFFIDSIGNHINKSMANGAPVSTATGQFRIHGILQGKRRERGVERTKPGGSIKPYSNPPGNLRCPRIRPIKKKFLPFLPSASRPAPPAPPSAGEHDRARGRVSGKRTAE